MPTLFINFEDFWSQGSLPLTSKKDFLSFVLREYGIDLIHQETVCFFDEVQYLPDALGFLKSLYDDTTLPIKILATGSRFLGQKKLGSGLVGRGKVIRVFPMTFAEVCMKYGRNIHDFHSEEGVVDSPFLETILAEYRIFGGYPAVVFAKNREEKIDALSRIVQRIFESDIIFFLGGDDVLPARQLFLFLAQNIGNRLNVEKLSEHLHISSKRVLKSLNFFIESYLLHEIPPYFSDRTREYSDRPKLYFHDTGLIHFLRGVFLHTASDGMITENILATELISTLQEGDSLNFYKKLNGSEIDFILQKIRTGDIIPIEAKSANQTSIPRIFHSFRELYPQIQTAYVSTHSRFLKRETVHFVPYWYLASRISSGEDFERVV